MNVIALKLDQLVEKHEDTDQKVSKLTDSVLDPESGLFAKVRINDMLTARNREDVDELYENVDKLLTICESHDKSVTAIEGWMKNHEERDDELRDSVKTLADSVKEYTDWTEEKFDEKDEELKPLKEDFTVRKANKVWKDKIIWIIISALILGIVVPPIVNLFTGNYQEKPKIETKAEKIKSSKRRR